MRPKCVKNVYWHDSHSPSHCPSISYEWQPAPKKQALQLSLKHPKFQPKPKSCVIYLSFSVTWTMSMLQIADKNVKNDSPFPSACWASSSGTVASCSSVSLSSWSEMLWCFGVKIWRLCLTEMIFCCQNNIPENRGKHLFGLPRSQMSCNWYQKIHPWQQLLEFWGISNWLKFKTFILSMGVSLATTRQLWKMGWFHTRSQ